MGISERAATDVRKSQGGQRAESFARQVKCPAQF